MRVVEYMFDTRSWKIIQLFVSISCFSLMRYANVLYLNDFFVGLLIAFIELRSERHHFKR